MSPPGSTPRPVPVAEGQLITSTDLEQLSPIQYAHIRPYGRYQFNTITQPDRLLPPRPAPRRLADLPASTAESTALARELKRRGFRFVGYATMRACGLVNDHLAGCAVRSALEAQRARTAPGA